MQAAGVLCSWKLKMSSCAHAMAVARLVLLHGTGSGPAEAQDNNASLGHNDTLP